MTKHLSYQNHQIFYRLEGSGKPVILVHGFGEDGSIWDRVIDPLKKNFQFIIPDLPGSGKSPIIDDMSMEGLAEIIHEIMKDQAIEKCPVIGHSMGGYITLALVEKYGDKVSGFGLFHSSSYADNDEKKQARRKGIAFIEEKGAEAFLKTSIPNLFSQETKDERHFLVDELLALAHNFSAPALVKYYEAMIERPDRTPLLSQTTVPVLFIMGKFDNAVPVEDSLEQSHLPGKSYIHLLRKSGHMGMLEETDKCSLALQEFLKDT